MEMDEKGGIKIIVGLEEVDEKFLKCNSLDELHDVYIDESIKLRALRFTVRHVLSDLKKLYEERMAEMKKENG